MKDVASAERLPWPKGTHTKTNDMNALWLNCLIYYAFLRCFFIESLLLETGLLVLWQRSVVVVGSIAGDIVQRCYRATESAEEGGRGGWMGRQRVNTRQLFAFCFTTDSQH